MTFRREQINCQHDCRKFSEFSQLFSPESWISLSLSDPAFSRLTLTNRPSICYIVRRGNFIFYILIGIPEKCAFFAWGPLALFQHRPRHRYRFVAILAHHLALLFELEDYLIWSCNSVLFYYHIFQGNLSEWARLDKIAPFFTSCEYFSWLPTEYHRKYHHHAG